MPGSTPGRHEIGIIAGIAVTHVLLTAWGLELVTQPENISLMWLPDGFLLGCLVLLPLRLWPWTVAAVVPSVVCFELATTDRPITTITLFLLANMTESVGGAAILRHVGARSGFRTFRHLGVFLALCVVALPAASAAIGALGVEVQDASVDFWSVYRTWFLSAGLGILVVAPLVIHGYVELRSRRATGRPLIDRELGFVLLLTMGVALTSSLIPTVSGVPVTLLFLSLPLLIWSAIRFGMWGSTTVSACLVLVLVHLSVFGSGAFSEGGVTSSVEVARLQSYLGSAIIATMFTALATERSWAAQSELERSLQRYSAMFNHSPVSLWEEDFSNVRAYLDQAYSGPAEELGAWFEEHPDEVAKCAELVRVAGVNSHTLRLFEADDESDLTTQLRDVFDEDTLEVFRSELVALALGQSEFRDEAKQLTLRGRPIQTLTSVAIVPGAEDDWSQVLVAIEDVTDRRQAEQALRRAQKMEAIGQMAGGIAHDFNNVLAVILGNLELVDDSDLDDQAAGSIRASRRAAERAAVLTGQLLRFSRRPSTDETVVDANEILEGMSNLVERSLTPAITVEYRLADDPLHITTDPGGLEDALLNLVINARDAMPEGGELVLETQEHRVDETRAAVTTLEPGDYVRISVSDTGVGMSAEVQDRVFEPFFSTKPETKGTGLGLAMVYAFATRSDGDVQIESRVGAGTRMHIDLPRAAQPSPTRTGPGREASGEAPGNETVLVVDDEPMLVRLVSSQLERLGYRVLTAGTADEALRRLDEAGEVHVLLSDIVMPGRNGHQLADEATKAHPGLRVVLTSGGEPGAASAKRPDFPILAKPYTASQLADQLQRVLDAPPPSPGIVANG